MTRPDAQPRRLRLPDGRSLAYQLYGAHEGRPLYYFHGFPGSRLQAALHHEQALAANVCLVAAGFRPVRLPARAQHPRLD